MVNYYHYNLDIKLVDQHNPDLKVYTYDEDRMVTNMKPFLVDGQIKFMDQHNYSKYLQAAQIELRKKKIKKQFWWNTKFKCFENKTYQQFKSKSDKQNIFRRGRCLPVVFVPGLMATRLKVNIDCEKVNRSIND